MARKRKKAGSEPKKSPKPRQDGRSEEQKVSHAVNHPTRLDAFSILLEQIASPKEIQEALRVPLATASHHVKELRDGGVIELVTTEQRRGAVEHFYKAKETREVTAEEWKALPKASRKAIVRVALQSIVADSLAALRHGKLEADDNMYVAWMPMRLSAIGEDEVTALQAAILDRLRVIIETDEARQIEEGSDERPVRIAVTMWFERAQPGRPRPAVLKVDEPEK